MPAKQFTMRGEKYSYEKIIDKVPHQQVEWKIVKRNIKKLFFKAQKDWNKIIQMQNTLWITSDRLNSFTQLQILKHPKTI